MLGELTPEQINAVLFSEVVVRIGCRGEGRTYIVPVIYVVDGEAVYAHSAEGLKIRMMREPKRVLSGRPAGDLGELAQRRGMGCL